MRSRSLVRHIYIVAALLAAAACGSGVLDVGHPVSVSGGGGGASVAAAATYDGIIADSLRHGRLSLQVAGNLSASGTLTFAGGPTVPLTGTVDTIAQTINTTGGGYTVTANKFRGTIQGNFTGPGGNGFLAATSDSLTALGHTSYCGTYTSTNGNGWMSMVILSDGESAGFTVNTAGRAVSTTFSGNLVGSITFTAQSDANVPINGTLAGGTITGTYSPPIGGTAGTGTFTVSSGGC